MFKIVKGATLTALRTKADLADQVPGLREQLDAARQQAATAEQAAQLAANEAETARKEAEQARADVETIKNDRILGLSALRDAVRDPNRRESTRGLIAVKVLRGLLEDAQTEAVKRGMEIDPGMRFVQMVILDENDDGTVQETPENPAPQESSNA